jgi:hypothetical protein
MCNNSALSKLIKQWMRWVLGKLNFHESLFLATLWGVSVRYISYTIITRACVCVCVCSSGHTEAYVNLCFTKTLCAAYEPPNPPQPQHSASQTTRGTVMRFLRTQMLQEQAAAPIEEKGWGTLTELLEFAHLHTCTVPKWTLCNTRNSLATTSMTACWIYIISS